MTHEIFASVSACQQQKLFHSKNTEKYVNNKNCALFSKIKINSISLIYTNTIGYINKTKFNRSKEKSP